MNTQCSDNNRYYNIIPVFSHLPRRKRTLLCSEYSIYIMYMAVLFENEADDWALNCVFLRGARGAAVLETIFHAFYKNTAIERLSVDE